MRVLCVLLSILLSPLAWAESLVIQHVTVIDATGKAALPRCRGGVPYRRAVRRASFAARRNARPTSSAVDCGRLLLVWVLGFIRPSASMNGGVTTPDR